MAYPETLPEAIHYLEQLQVNPGFSQLQANIAGDFERMVDQLLDTDPQDAALTQRLIGELRGIRYAMRTPARLARLARETNT